MSLKLLRNNYLILIIILIGCNSKNCKNITENNITGYYISMNDANKNKQYLDIHKGGLFYNRYCKGDTLIEEINKWDHIIGCSVVLHNVFWLNNFFNKDERGGANFDFENGVLSLGEDDYSFRKVWFKPKLECE